MRIVIDKFRNQFSAGIDITHFFCFICYNVETLSCSLKFVTAGKLIGPKGELKIFKYTDKFSGYIAKSMFIPFNNRCQTFVERTCLVKLRLNNGLTFTVCKSIKQLIVLVL